VKYLIGLCLLLSACSHGVPVADLPYLPVDVIPKTEIANVNPTRTANGMEFSLEDFEKTLRMVKWQQAESEALRKMIDVYNKYVEEQRKKALED